MQGPDLAQVTVMEGEAMEYKKEEVVGFLPGWRMGLEGRRLRIKLLDL
jgi:hypothetical protein